MKPFDDRIETKSLIESGLEIEIAIDLVKSTFSQVLSEKLSLTRVTSPIAVEDNTGINDDLNGVERAVSFPILDIGNIKGVVVQSLAKWKRLRLHQLGVPPGKGIITDMKALRPDEKLSQLHSIFVDQWDWERVLAPEDRTIEKLKEIVQLIYSALVYTEKIVFQKYPGVTPILPPQITFIHSQQLADMYPTLTPKEREDEIAKKYGAVFIIGIGADLTDGKPHDGRAPDYDDWSTVNSDGFKGLNGDIIVWNPVLESAFELSSMGIRVDEEALLRQLEIRGCLERKSLLFHQLLLSGQLPQTIGGGIGQSRVCMFMLRKKHIGEVQVGIWPQHTRLAYQAQGIDLL